MIYTHLWHWITFGRKWGMRLERKTQVAFVLVLKLIGFMDIYYCFKTCTCITIFVYQITIFKCLKKITLLMHHQAFWTVWAVIHWHFASPSSLAPGSINIPNRSQAKHKLIPTRFQFTEDDPKSTDNPNTTPVRNSNSHSHSHTTLCSGLVVLKLEPASD